MIYTDMSVIRLAEYLRAQVVGFDGLDLEDYEDCKLLSPYVGPLLGAVERYDVLVDRVELRGWQLWCFPERPLELGAEPGLAVVTLPAGLIERARELSRGPRVPWLVAVPPTEVAWLDRLDEILFGEGWEPGRVYMNAADYAYVRQQRRGRLDFVTSVSLLRLGWQGVLYAPAFEPWTAEEDDFWAGWQVWISRLVPCGSIYVETVASAEPLVEAPPEDRLISIWTLGE
jgi:hypothetical protein